MKDINKYVEYIKDEKTKIEVRKFWDKVLYVEKNYSNTISDFMNPYEISLCLPLLNKSSIKYILYPNNLEAERKSIIMFPEYFENVDIEEFLSGIRILNKSKFKELFHKDYLGVIMSQGIERSKIGDIFVHLKYADIIVQDEIVDYLLYNIEKIGKNKIEISRISLEEVKFKEPDFIFDIIIISSLRLDNVVKALIHKQREYSSNIIKSGDVKVNWQVITKNAISINEGDLLSIRHYGRFKIVKIMGMTKNNRYKVKIKMYRDKNSGDKNA